MNPPKVCFSSEFDESVCKLCSNQYFTFIEISPKKTHFEMSILQYHPISAEIRFKAINTLCIYLLKWYIRIHRITIITFSKNRWVNLTKKVFHIDFRVLLIFKKIYHFSAFRNPSHASCEYQFPVGTKSENCVHFYLQKCVKNVEKMPVSLNRINSRQASAILVVYVVILIDRRIVFQ